MKAVLSLVVAITFVIGSIAVSACGNDGKCVGVKSSSCCKNKGTKDVKEASMTTESCATSCKNSSKVASNSAKECCSTGKKARNKKMTKSSDTPVAVPVSDKSTVTN